MRNKESVLETQAGSVDITLNDALRLKLNDVAYIPKEQNLLSTAMLEDDGIFYKTKREHEEFQMVLTNED